MTPLRISSGGDLNAGIKIEMMTRGPALWLLALTQWHSLWSWFEPGHAPATRQHSVHYQSVPHLLASTICLYTDCLWAWLRKNDKIITKKWLLRFSRPDIRPGPKLNRDKWCHFCALMLSLGFILSLTSHEEWYCAKISRDHQVQSKPLPSEHSTMQTSGILTDKCGLMPDAGIWILELFLQP